MKIKYSESDLLRHLKQVMGTETVNGMYTSRVPLPTFVKEAALMLYMMGEEDHVIRSALSDLMAGGGLKFKENDMAEETNKVIFRNGGYCIVPKGSELIIANPNWDGDRPETHYNIRIKILEDICVETLGMENTFEGVFIRRENAK